MSIKGHLNSFSFGQNIKPRNKAAKILAKMQVDNEPTTSPVTLEEI